MNEVIRILFTKPTVAFVGWVKRNPWKTVFILLGMALAWELELLIYFLGLRSFAEWLKGHQWARSVLNVAVSMVNPVFGAWLFIWQIVDLTKKPK